MLGFESASVLALITGAFLLAGFVKGAVGVGLPTISMGLLSLVMLPAQAAALLFFPAFITNVWQLLSGPALGRVLRRLWPMMVCVCLCTWVGFGAMVGDNPRIGAFALGLVIAVSSALTLAEIRFHVAPENERWMSPLMGSITGFITGATGTFLFPSVPYMVSLDIPRDELVQSLGLSALVSSFALGIALWLQGTLTTQVAGNSLYALVPAFLGMVIGTVVRKRVSERTFRRYFQVGMMLLGLYIAAKNWP